MTETPLEALDHAALIAWAENLEAQADIIERGLPNMVTRDLLPWGLGIGKLRHDARALRARAALTREG